jgi:hypothetical protein
VALDEVPDVLGDGIARDVASRSNAFGHLLRHILRPMFERVERDDANRSIELPDEQIGDDGSRSARSISVSRYMAPATPKLSTTR